MIKILIASEQEIKVSTAKEPCAKKSVFENSLQDLAHGFLGNTICFPTQLDTGYNTSILESCRQKVVYKVGEDA